MSPARHLLTLGGRAYAAARSAATHLPSRLAVFAVVSMSASWPLLSTAASLNQFRDAHVLSHYEQVARDSILTWHQLPLWDPYYCGGMYLLGTPQSRFVSPTFLLTLIFGEARGEALAVFAMMLLGLEGAFRYLRERRSTSLGALLAAPAFALSGLFAISPSLGWVSFFGFELLPWIALGVRWTLRGRAAGVLLVAATAAWCVGMGGTYAAPLAAVWAAYEVAGHVLSCARARAWRRLGSGLGALAAASLLAAGLSAVRLWPIFETLREAPRIIGGTPGEPWPILARMLFLNAAPDMKDGSFFVGLLAVPAALVGLRRRSAAPLGIATFVWAWLAAGYGLHPSLFALLRELPLYTTLRYPERFLVLFALSFAALGARGVSFAEAWLRACRARGRARGLGAARALLVVTAVCLVANVAPLARQHDFQADTRALDAPPVAVEPTPPFRQARGTRWGLQYYEPMQRGSLSCWEAYPVPQSPLLRGDLEAEQGVLPPSEGSVDLRRWTPNAIDLDVDLPRPGTIFVNQNWNRGWRASAGEVVSTHGLLTVALPAGKRRVSLRFEPRSASGGALASVAALAALAVVAWRAKRRTGAVPGALLLGALALAPLVPVLAVAAVVREPTFHEPATAQDGQPVVASKPPEGADRLDVRFAGGMSLEAVALTGSPRPGADLTLELDWRRDVALEKGLGVFIHIEPSSGKGMNGDHVLLSSVLDPDEAPPGKTLRDIMPLWIPEDGKGKKWKVWVGLWRVRRGGERVPVVTSGTAFVEKDRVLAATIDLR